MRSSIPYEGYKVRHDFSDLGGQEWFAEHGQPFCNLGAAFLRKDGYVSLESDGSGTVGIVETKPIRFSGRHLFVNADASAGTIQVELCNASGEPLHGFGREDVRPLTTDDLRHRVEWDATADLSDLVGKAVVLRFHLDGYAPLYSYRFGDPDPHLPGSD